ncbi:MAG: NFACT family protein [Candidatus Manganitrophus sp.]|nr:NFACT family protein [Candidatus Manganitrophus sp.]
MSLSAGQIGKVLAEIGDTLRGGVIQKIDQPQPWSLVFEIHQRRERVHLYFSGQRRFSRIHLTNEKHPNPSSPPGSANSCGRIFDGNRSSPLNRSEETGSSE